MLYRSYMTQINVICVYTFNGIYLRYLQWKPSLGMESWGGIVDSKLKICSSFSFKSALFLTVWPPLRKELFLHKCKCKFMQQFFIQICHYWVIWQIDPRGKWRPLNISIKTGRLHKFLHFLQLKDYLRQNCKMLNYFK